MTWPDEEGEAELKETGNGDAGIKWPRGREGRRDKAKQTKAKKNPHVDNRVDLVPLITMRMI